ncbi:MULTISPECIES: amidase [Gordonibacter]|uniref:Amidase n=1 Tax=Gordonibacter faecis TaxID=3047475 RepID=A0ABT7DQ94_9ACTN|nr:MULTISPECIES: amidase [unclassified Gordonibacter]MDJ1650703.1 amidase [Gordonibacter sp. KGMB12511]
MIADEYLSGVDLASDIKAKKVSPVEVMEECVASIEARNPSLNAFTYTAFDEAREKAAEAEKALMHGDAHGAFFGVPTAAKDFLPGVPGWPGTTGGVKALAHMKDDGYGCYTKAMVDEGAILVGKTNAPSFAFRGTCDNKLFGATSTPFKVGFNSGGSSGGSAAAVGDGMLLVAEGTDGGGSIRIPAAWCGCYGYKASVGTIPAPVRPNAFSLTHPYTWDGSISRTVKDAAHALQAMACFDPFDPVSIDWGERNFIAALEKPLSGWRVGFTPDFGIFPVDPEIKALVAAAAQRFEEAGAQVEPVEFGLARSHFELAEAWCRLISISGMESVEALKNSGIDLLKDHADDLPSEFVYWINDTYRRNYVDYNADDVVRTEIYDALQTAFQTYDLIISPVTACHPVPNVPGGCTAGPAELAGERVEPIIGWCLTYFCNFTGHPAASIPVGLSKDGFPVGMQIIGRRWADEDVLAASAAFERLQPWADLYRITAERDLG